MTRPGTQRLLVLNAGSSSIKFAIFDEELTEVISGLAECIGGASRLKVGSEIRQGPFIDHRAALNAILSALRDLGLSPETLTAAGHRVVHGGRKLTRPVRISPEVRAEIAACSPLAPLHNPHNLAAIDTLAGLAPELPQFASFDTSFHV